MTVIAPILEVEAFFLCLECFTHYSHFHPHISISTPSSHTYLDRFHTKVLVHVLPERLHTHYHSQFTRFSHLFSVPKLSFVQMTYPVPFH